jgi:multisubunit Na+/H+ antiporter MnhC subunit
VTLQDRTLQNVHCESQRLELNCRTDEVTVQVPPVPYRSEAGCGLDFEQPLVRPRTLAFMAAFIVIGLAVWALAIAKLVDLYRSL